MVTLGNLNKGVRINLLLNYKCRTNLAIELFKIIRLKVDIFCFDFKNYYTGCLSISSGYACFHCACALKMAFAIKKIILK